MARAAFRHFAFTLSTTALLMGCVPGGGSDGSGGTSAGTAASPSAMRGGSREVEAPDVFQVTDSALWDGRPSLGGIWIASPDATDPERVVMFNPATGKSVTGALFRRERDNPGPTLQISSDAAEALGILAGQPTELRVTALRKEEVAAPAEAPVADPAVAEGATPTDPAVQETAALAAAALDATADAAPDAAVAASDAAVAATPAEPPRRKTWAERRAEAKAKREAEKAAKAAAAAGAATDPAAAGTDAVDPAAGTVAAIETAPLDARAPEVAAGTAPAPEKKTRRQIRAEEAAAAAAAKAAAEAPPAPEAPAAATGGRPIQVASFSKEENARRATEALAKIGITAQPQKSERDGKAVWGVVAVGDAALLDKIKAAGFADAFFLQ
ncbi:SPOR domain-containing protein [Tabrizicola aquatica]|uniref:SPOR domain-containing protein n=1 Tax=Tabrizicola aquatica TaxID=909926 RepID=UPI0011AF3B3D